MKKILYILMCIMTLAASSCSKNEPGDDTATVNINATIDDPDLSRANAAITRYVLSIYEGSLSATPTTKVSADGTFNITMKKGISYTLLFWADGGEQAYTATNLMAVAPAADDNITLAYQGSVTTKPEDFNGAVSLTRAVSEVNFVETTGFTDTGNTLVVTYPTSGSKFNVSDGTVTRTGEAVTRTFTGIAATAANGTLATDYVLAPITKSVLANVKIKFNAQDEVNISSVAIQANYKSNIKGTFKN